MRIHGRRDRTEPEILRALQQAGADYILLDSFDVLCLFRGHLSMLDCKGATGKPTKRQAELVQRGWPLTFVRTPEEALVAIGCIP